MNQPETLKLVDDKITKVKKSADGCGEILILISGGKVVRIKASETQVVKE